jgi:purine nucleosidase
MQETLVFRSLWFWIVIILIVGGIALTAALGVLYWLLGAFAVAILVILAVFTVAAYRVGSADPLQIPSLQKVSYSERIPVVYDCDVTMGHPFRDPGDGLALLYLLGEPCVYLRAVTTTYGNGPVEMTTRAARRLLDGMGYDGVAVLPGAAGPGKKPEANQAARHLVEVVNERPGEVVVIATGSMTNLKHAAMLDPGFFEKLGDLYLLGGMTEPMVWNGRRLAECNFSLDPEAAYQALHADCPVTVATGQAGLTAVFRIPEFASLQTLADPVSRLIVRRIRFWLALMRLWFQDGGFGMWDSIPVLAFTHPEFFEFDQVYITSTRDELHAGRLFVDPSRHGPVRLVRSVRDFGGFITAHFAAWHHLGQRVDARRG